MWIILEGLDRSGKSSVAEKYKKLGYKIHHMSAPNKKYLKTAYTGPSYADEIIELYMKYDGENVLFDRSIYGEVIWPTVFNRKPQLNEDDIEALREFELRNDAEYILMYDSDVDAHWKRCVNNNEPLTRGQFNHAAVAYGQMAAKYNFKKKQLKDYKDMKNNEDDKKTINTKPKQPEPIVEEVKVATKTVGQIKLEKANAINQVLNSRIIKRKGDMYDALEEDIRLFLEDKLSELFGTESKKFTPEEINILKLFCKQMLNKAEEKK
jgi:thymidylate kinase